MENNFNQPNPNSNWNVQNTYKPEISDGNTSQILGIIGLVLTFCTGCSVIGLVLSILAWVKGNNAIKLFEMNPGQYAEKSYSQAKTGRTLGIIGVIFGSLAFVGIIIYVIIMGVAGAMQGFN